jgi:hypothetical protein
VPDELTEKRDRMLYLLQENEKILKRLSDQGFVIDREALYQVRIEYLVDSLLGSIEDSEGRLDFEVRVAEHVKRGLENTEKDIKKRAAIRRLHLPNNIGRDGGLEKP